MFKKNNTYQNIIVTLASTAFFCLSGCASLDRDREYDENYKSATEQQAKLRVEKSFLTNEEGQSDLTESIDDPEQAALSSDAGFSKLKSMERDGVTFKSNQMEGAFSTTKKVRVSANNMPLDDYLHYVFGELLNVNYLLTPEISKINAPVTLSIAEELSQRQLFRLSQTVLLDRGVSIKFNGEVYLIAKLDAKSKLSTEVGIGRTADTIPTASDNILQVVPILYGIKSTLKTTVEELSNVSVTLDARQGTLFVRGDKANVERALELVQLLDSPANRGRNIGLVKLTFSSIDLYMQQISLLLENEGIPNSIADPGTNNLVFVPLYQIGAVAIFSASEELLRRVEFWTKTLDQPSEGDVKQYYVFHPKYARATDIGSSLTPLVTGGRSSKVKDAAKVNQADKSGPSTNQLSQSERSTGASSDELTFVVDERTNALIFYTTGTNYKNILPLVHKLDVLPKQVMLQLTIAEVTLTDEFKFGVDFALSDGKFDFSSSFGATDIGGGVLKWASGGNLVNAQAFKSNKLVNVLSNPSILVRDGVAASILVGTDIPVLGSTSTGSGGDILTQSVSYRKTGISVNVTPTINAQGVVIMSITQTNSNQVDDELGAQGNPLIFERSLTTEVVAESGQTIIMGGLISENVSDNERGLPGLRDIPVLGALFGSITKSKVKTELVIMVTPRVISRSDQWRGIMDAFKNSVETLHID